MVGRAGVRRAGGSASFLLHPQRQRRVTPPPCRRYIREHDEGQHRDDRRRIILRVPAAVRDRFVAVTGSSGRLGSDGEEKDLMLQPITTIHYVILSAALLLIGTIGVLTRRNIVIILMSIELILNAVNINLIAFSQHLQNMGGQIFAIFVITDAVAEAAVGLGILIALFRNKETVQADQIDLLKW